MLNNPFRKNYLTITLTEVLGRDQLTTTQASKGKRESEGERHII